MDLQIALEQRGRVEEFRKKHRVGVLTLLFTDVVGSTKLKQVLGDREAVAVIQRHHSALREILETFAEGEEIGTAGDSFFIVFAKPSDAVKFSLLVQAKLRALAVETGYPVLDRIGIHIGEVWIEEPAETGRPKDLYGIQIDTCSRVQSLGSGDQILMTRFVFDSARQALKGDDLENTRELSWLNHGPYSMKGVDEPLEVCEVGETGKAVLTAPPDSEKATRFISSDSEPVLGWRPAVDLPVPGTSWVLEKKLGEGGFGEVWLGRDKILKTRHVFKFCFRADRVRSLKREVTLFRLLKERIGDHPNIVGVEKVYFDEPPYYIVMEYVEGQNLAKWSEAQGGVDKAPLQTRLEIVAQVADALQAAHDSGIIHRDVKPSNILVSGGGADVHVHLTDFGIGQVVSEEALAGVTRMGFTQTIMESASQSGTHLYMAPELFAGKAASTRSDIYALGVVLYQLVTDDFARPVTTDWEKQITDPSLREDLEKCFAGDPKDRFSQARQFADQVRALERRRMAVTEQQASTRAKEKIESLRAQRSRRWRRAWRTVQWACVATLCAAILWLALGMPGALGAVEITTEPAGAEIWQSGQKIGVTPFTQQDANPGRIAFSLKMNGYLGCDYTGILKPLHTLTFHTPLVTTTSLPTATVPNEPRILSKEGIVEIQKSGGQWLAVDIATTRPQPGDRLRTGSYSRVTVRLSDGSVMKVNESTILELSPSGTKPTLNLKKGAIFFFSRERTPEIHIETPVASGAIRG